MTRRNLLHLLAFAIVAGAISAGLGGRLAAARQPAPAEFVATSQQAGGPGATVLVRDGAIEAPAVVPTGLVAITFDNASAGEFYGVVLRLNDGATAEAILAAYLTGDEAALQRLPTALGGPGGISPGQRQEITFDLQTGEHLIVAFDDLREIPVVAGFRAEPPAVATTPPATAGTIEMGDFYFGVPEMPAGTNRFTLSNVGQQLHHMILARLAPGVTLDEALAAEEMGVDAVDAGLVEVVPGVSEMSPGQTAYPTLGFSPGTYAMVCFITDPESGAPHIALGMASSFTVR